MPSGSYTLNTTKASNSNITFSLTFRVIDFKPDTVVFTSQDNIALSGSSTLAAGSYSYEVQKYIDYNAVHRSICSTGCTVATGTFNVLNTTEKDWTIDLATKLNPGEYKVVLNNNQEIVFQVRAAIGTSNTSTTISLPNIVLQEDTWEDNFIFSSFNNLDYKVGYSAYHKVEIIRPDDWNEQSVLGDPYNTSYSTEFNSNGYPLRDYLNVSNGTPLTVGPDVELELNPLEIYNSSNDSFDSSRLTQQFMVDGSVSESRKVATDFQDYLDANNLSFKKLTPISSQRTVSENLFGVGFFPNDLLAAANITKDYSDLTTLQYGNYFYQRILGNDKTTYVPQLGRFSRAIQTSGACGGNCGTYYDVNSPMDFLEPSLTGSENLFKESTVRSIFDSYAYRALGDLINLPPNQIIERNFEARLYRYDTNGNEIYDVITVTVELVPVNDYAKFESNQGTAVSPFFTELDAIFDIPSDLYDFLDTVENNTPLSSEIISADEYPYLQTSWQHDYPERVDQINPKQVNFYFHEFDYGSQYVIECYFEEHVINDDNTGVVITETDTTTEYETPHYVLVIPKNIVTAQWASINNPINTITVRYKDINKFTPLDSKPSNVLIAFKETTSGNYDAVSNIRFGSFWSFGGTGSRSSWDYSYDIDDIVIEATSNYASAPNVSSFPTNTLFTIDDVDYVDSDTVKDDITDGGFTSLTLTATGLLPSLTEKLIVLQGETILLSEDGSGTLINKPYTYSATNSVDGKTTVLTIDFPTAGISNDELKSFLESLKYTITNDFSEILPGERELEITSLSKIASSNNTKTTTLSAKINILGITPYYVGDPPYFVYSETDAHPGIQNISGFAPISNYAGFSLSFSPELNSASTPIIRSTDVYDLGGTLVSLDENGVIKRLSDNITIGQWNTSNNVITINLNAQTTETDVDNIINSLVYSSTEKDGENEKLKVSWVLTDTNVSYDNNLTFRVIAVDDAPEITMPSNLSIAYLPGVGTAPVDYTTKVTLQGGAEAPVINVNGTKIFENISELTSIESDQNIAEFTFSIEASGVIASGTLNSPTSGEKLKFIDAQAVYPLDLNNGNSYNNFPIFNSDYTLTIASNSYSTNGSITTNNPSELIITIRNPNGNSDATFLSFLSQIEYINASSSFTNLATRTFKVKEITDSGLQDTSGIIRNNNNTSLIADNDHYTTKVTLDEDAPSPNLPPTVSFYSNTFEDYTADYESSRGEIRTILDSYITVSDGFGESDGISEVSLLIEGVKDGATEFLYREYYDSSIEEVVTLQIPLNQNSSGTLKDSNRDVANYEVIIGDDDTVIFKVTNDWSSDYIRHFADLSYVSTSETPTEGIRTFSIQSITDGLGLTQTYTPSGDNLTSFNVIEPLPLPFTFKWLEDNSFDLTEGGAVVTTTLRLNGTHPTNYMEDEDGVNQEHILIINGKDYYVYHLNLNKRQNPNNNEPISVTSNHSLFLDDADGSIVTQFFDAGKYFILVEKGISYTNEDVELEFSYAQNTNNGSDELLEVYLNALIHSAGGAGYSDIKQIYEEESLDIKTINTYAAPPNQGSVSLSTNCFLDRTDAKGVISVTYTNSNLQVGDIVTIDAAQQTGQTSFASIDPNGAYKYSYTVTAVTNESVTFPLPEGLLETINPTNYPAIFITAKSGSGSINGSAIADVLLFSEQVKPDYCFLVEENILWANNGADYQDGNDVLQPTGALDPCDYDESIAGNYTFLMRGDKLTDLSLISDWDALYIDFKVDNTSIFSSTGVVPQYYPPFARSFNVSFDADDMLAIVGASSIVIHFYNGDPSNGGIELDSFIPSLNILTANCGDTSGPILTTTGSSTTAAATAQTIAEGETSV
ncbi:hypothetical protein, partial [uncultured Polaribacter sp.]|uniref:hypothetical protein n=1 Tax=uncultured Polaribacter sp. TaxID=174711 RepID=UPI00261474DF